MPAWLYILRLRSGRLYVGSTAQPLRRLGEHSSAHGSGRTTANDRPTTLIHAERFETLSDARLREVQIKRWSRAKKEALVSGDADRLRELARRRRTDDPAR